MEMTVLVLVSAVAMLISPGAANPVHHLNLNHIIDLAEKYNKTLTERYFVEDVTDLADSGCGDRFFCKVHEILKKHAKNDKEKEIVRNLEVFIESTTVNCEEELKDMPEARTEKPLPDLLGKLTTCIHRRNFMGNRKQNA